MRYEPEAVSRSQMREIVDRLAWMGIDVEHEVREHYGLDGDDIEVIMREYEYEWDSDADVWASKWELWSGWNGALPSESGTS